ncbi:Uncharacterized protein HZ326_17349 [Fusarium oxysporum f. sp. albedinis]|nr:Uncharacterized protein HZ326_17349 [Fusarium oxysporum f. sp. albedinis]
MINGTLSMIGSEMTRGSQMIMTFRRVSIGAAIPLCCWSYLITFLMITMLEARASASLPVGREDQGVPTKSGGSGRCRPLVMESISARVNSS